MSAVESVELLPVEINTVKPSAPVTARVVENRLCTSGRRAAGFVRHVSFDVTGTPLAGKVKAGQSFGIIPPGHDEKGKPHKVRLYSSASPSAGEDGAGNVIATCCKRLIDENWENHKLHLGTCSNYVCDMAEGDEVQLTGPAGKRFVLPADPVPWNYVFFSTGTGIAPFRGMVQDLLAAGGEGQIVMVAGATYSTDLLYHADFLRHEQQSARFTYLPALSREKQADGHDAMYVDGRVETNADQLIPLLTLPNTLIYLCGLSGMELGIFRSLARHLTGHALEQYLQIDGELLSDMSRLERSMLGRALKKTDRVLTEVYD